MQNLLSHLPATSAFIEARLNDPAVAEQVLAAHQENTGPGRPPLTDFTPEVAMLANVFDRMGEMVAWLTVLAGQKAANPQPAPRPVTGVDRARRRLEDAQHQALVDEVAQAQARWLAAQASGESASVKAE